MGGKRFTIILILAFVLLFPTSCQRPEPPEEGFTIGVSYDTSGFFPTSWVEALEREAEKEGIHVISICADSSTQKQISDIELLIARKPDVIIVRPNHPEGILLPLEYIRQAEIPCILLDFEIAEGYESYYDVLLKDDATAEGMVQADYIKGWLAENPGREAKIGYISGPYDGPASLKGATHYTVRWELKKPSRRRRGTGIPPEPCLLWSAGSRRILKSTYSPV